MADMVRFFLPGIPPSVNHAYNRFVDRRGHVRRQLTTEAKQWIEDAQLIARTTCKAAGWRLAEQKVIIRYWVVWPDNRRRDCDNLGKLLMDSLTGVVYTDDRWALPRVMDWAVNRTNPGILVEIELANADNVGEERTA